MSDATTARERTLQDTEDTEEPSFNFELHYGLSSGSVRDVLDEILEDMASFTHIHDWDKKLITSPLGKLVGVARRYVKANDLSLNTLLGHSSVEEILTVHGVNHVQPAMQHTAKTASCLFFNKVRVPLPVNLLIAIC